MLRKYLLNALMNGMILALGFSLSLLLLQHLIRYGTVWKAARTVWEEVHPPSSCTANMGTACVPKAEDQVHALSLYMKHVLPLCNHHPYSYCHFSAAKIRVGQCKGRIQKWASYAGICPKKKRIAKTGEGQGDPEDKCGLFAPETQSASTDHLGNRAQPHN